MQQKFKWNKCSEILPNNAQDWMFVSYIMQYETCKRPMRFVAAFLYFDPSRHIVDGKLMYGSQECDYWSAMPNLPRNAINGVLNTEPAVLILPQMTK